jgi:hypothetical protein
MVHQGESLPFGLESGDHLLGVHAPLDELQGNSSPDRLFLLGFIDDALYYFSVSVGGIGRCR